jgi:hypothetical protein
MDTFVSLYAEELLPVATQLTSRLVRPVLVVDKYPDEFLGHQLYEEYARGDPAREH